MQKCVEEKISNLAIVEHHVKLTNISEAFVQCLNKDCRQKDHIKKVTQPIKQSKRGIEQQAQYYTKLIKQKVGENTDFNADFKLIKQKKSCWF